MTKKETIKLGWDILRYKYWYYIENDPIIGDYEFDQLEKKYRDACEKLNIPPSASDLVGFSFDKPSCVLVAAKEQGLDLKSVQEGRIFPSPLGIGKKKKKKKKRK